MIKNISVIESKEILDFYSKLDHGMSWTTYGQKRQVGLQYKVGDDPWTSAVGRSQGDELRYDQLNQYFAGTIFETIINEYKLKRTRLMWVEPYSCYSMHRDETPRIHIPLITNPQCFFVFKSGVVEHLPINNVYWVDTRETHTFANCSEYSRLHLVGVVES